MTYVFVHQAVYLKSFGDLLLVDIMDFSEIVRLAVVLSFLSCFNLFGQEYS